MVIHSLGSTVVSPFTVIVTDFAVSPGANVTVPLAALKSVATAGAYSLYRPAGRKAPAVEAFLAALAEGDPRSVAPLLRNDLESGVFGEWPVLAGLRKLLLGTGALGARMTGSGSVVFGLAWDEDHARQVAKRVEQIDLGIWVRVARAIPVEA